MHPFALHRWNAARLGGRDVVVAGYPASGAALVGNILTELGFGHLDPYTETVLPDGTSAVVEDRMTYRRRLAATAAEDRRHGVHRSADGLRFVKNHLHPDAFDAGRLAGAVLLVRDPRDAIHSAYHWFRGFAERWRLGDNGRGTFAAFLDGPVVNGEPPVEGWTRFCAAWLDALPAFRRSAVVRFEDLKSDPAAATAALLRALGQERAPREIARAVRASSYEAMRAHETAAMAEDGDRGADGPRIMRRGQVGEWREWIGDPALAARFRDPDLAATAARFGYRLSTSEGTAP
ncbi:sulfotransferase domain-containing protein [Streptomyces caatingaensis]|uniref:Sulfotransferase domain-containing protein n=1 Tax=Streptomyces caatingaensis TaxID=1678637 RepID=A0A0K9XFN1_9ACTN|nr:sulfotransferase domain-containing protein [Streptomyces caatingaensis]KNB52180.1 hypothetical protein AC230_11515 [Streptomyces caatingaensis]